MIQNFGEVPSQMVGGDLKTMTYSDIRKYQVVENVFSTFWLSFAI